jgi:hypothetical protein
MSGLKETKRKSQKQKERKFNSKRESGEKGGGRGI